jgi:hypothetical protein
LNLAFEEVQVFSGVAERTGNRVARADIRAATGVCRSLAELGKKFRRLGDGIYYLDSGAWPADSSTVDLSRVWKTLN